MDESATDNIRVLIVAAYASVRAGLHALLAGADACRVVAEVSGSGELERLMADADADVVVCEDTEGDGARVLQLLAGREVGLIVLADTARLSGALVASDLPGYALLRKDAEAREIVAACRAVAAGLVVFDRALAPPPASVPVAAGLPAAPIPTGEALTAREREVLQLMARGLPNKQIGARLGISAHTAKFHVAAVLAKLGATSRTEAVTLGARRGDVLL